MGDDDTVKTVLLSGPFLSLSGYGTHGRMLARWLLDKPDTNVVFNITPWGDTPTALNPDMFDGLVGKIMQRSVQPGQVRADVSVQLKLPNEWDPNLAPVNIGVTAAVETDRCHPDWVAACNRMTAVIVPSQHAKSSLTNTGNVTRPLLVIPESYCDAVVHPDLPSLPQFDTSFNFLVFGQLTGNNPHNDRKNLFNTIKWLCEAFKDDKDVGIVLKTNMGRMTKIDRGMVKGLLTQLLKEARKGPYPKLHLVHGDMTEPEVASLYKHPQVKALVTLTRGEGFGLPVLEAAASGLPIIATGWSGYQDFLKVGKHVSIYYQLQEIHKSRVDNRIFVSGARWAEPSEEDFKKRVQKFRDSPTIPKEWATDLQKKVLETHSHKNICAMLDAALKEWL